MNRRIHLSCGACLNAKQGRLGFVDEMKFLSVKTDFCSFDKFEAKAFEKRREERCLPWPGLSFCFSVMSSRSMH